MTLYFVKPDVKELRETGTTYKRQKNRVNNLIRAAKAEYHTNLLEENVAKPETFWKCIKNLFPTKPKNTVGSTKFNLDGELINDKTRIADGFCNFFQPVSVKLKHDSIKLRNLIWSRPTKKEVNTNAIFHFKHVSVPEVIKHLRQLKKNKSEGID